MADEQKMYVQDFDGEKLDAKTILERKVMEGAELSTDDRLLIIRALEKAGDSVFNQSSGLNQDLGLNYPSSSPGIWQNPVLYRSLDPCLDPNKLTVTCKNNLGAALNTYTSIAEDASDKCKISVLPLKTSSKITTNGETI